MVIKERDDRPDTPNSLSKAPDLSGVNHHNRNAFYYASHLILFSGLFIFEWEPVHVYLGVVFNMILSMGSTTVTLWMRVPFSTAFKSTCFLLPAFYLALSFTLPFFYSDATYDMRTGFGLLLYAGAVLCSIINHFISTTLKIQRFHEYMDEKYIYEDGRPLISDKANVLVAVIHVWGTYIFFAIAWLAAGIISISTQEGGEKTFSGSTIMAANLGSDGCALLVLLLMIGRENMDWFSMNFYHCQYPEHTEMSSLISRAKVGTIVYRDTGEAVEVGW